MPQPSMCHGLTQRWTKGSLESGDPLALSGPHPTRGCPESQRTLGFSLPPQCSLNDMLPGLGSLEPPNSRPKTCSTERLEVPSCSMSSQNPPLKRVFREVKEVGAVGFQGWSVKKLRWKKGEVSPRTVLGGTWDQNASQRVTAGSARPECEGMVVGGGLLPLPRARGTPAAVWPTPRVLPML